MKIGFFGDSFCAWHEPPVLSKRTHPETYIKKIQKHYNADIVNLGINGSSIYDLMLLQIKPFIEKNEYPDVCVFVWTNYARLFHRSYRGMNAVSVQYKDDSDPIINAAKQYFIHLLDWESHRFQYEAALQYFDLNTLSKFPNTTKIIHCWAYKNIYEWKHGVVANPAQQLIELALQDRTEKDLANDIALNHLDTEDKNNIVFETIKTAIDNYE
jgi:hypothetical protein